MAAQIAKHIFNVKRVICRIYDPLRQDIFASFGLEVVHQPHQNFCRHAKETNWRATNKMYFVIIGGGRVGYYLTKALLKEGPRNTDN